MSLVLINGISTAGKTTTARELTTRGYQVYDTDLDGMSAWYDKETDERAAEFGKVADRSKEWADRHEWRVAIERVKVIAEHAIKSDFFLCGGAANETEMIAHCDQVIWLQTDEQTIRSRVIIPRDHTYGTREHEVVSIIEGNQRKEKLYREMGAHIVDARQTIEDVVASILSFCSPSL